MLDLLWNLAQRISYKKSYEINLTIQIVIGKLQVSIESRKALNYKRYSDSFAWAF
jgi:hypothetical protein